MAESPEDLKKTLSEVEQFLEKLSKEKLGKSTKREREDILSKLKQVKELQGKGDGDETGDVYEQTDDDPSTYEDVTTAKGSISSDRSQSTSSLTDQPYGDVDETIPVVPAQSLLEPDFAAYVDKKRREGPLKLPAWQRRWFVIKNNTLFYYEKHTDKKQKGAVRLEGYEIKTADDLDTAPKVDRKKKDLYFQLVKTGNRVYQFIALNHEDFKLIIHTIHKITPPASQPQDDEVYEDASTAKTEEENLYEDTENLKSKMEEPNEDDVYDDTMSPEDVYDDTVSPNQPDDVYDDTMSPEEVYDDTVSPNQPKAPSPVQAKPPAQLPEEGDDDDDVYEDTVSASQTPALPPRPGETPHDKPTPLKRDLPPPPPDPVEDSSSGDQPPPIIPKRELPPPPEDGSSSGDMPPPVLPKRELPPPPTGDGSPPSPAKRELPSPPSQQNHTPPPPKVITVPLPENDLPNMYMAMWDCSADAVEDLAFKRGDLIQVVSREYEAFSWWVGFLDGKVGLVPKEYLMQAYEL